jgi:hypothetical protein
MKKNHSFVFKRNQRLLTVTMSSIETSSILPRRIKIKWPQLNITVTAEMSTQLNPGLVGLLFDNLPYRSLQNHALVSGDHLYHLVPSERLIVSKIVLLSRAQES